MPKKIKDTKTRRKDGMPSAQPSTAQNHKDGYGKVKKPKRRTKPRSRFVGRCCSATNAMATLSNRFIKFDLSPNALLQTDFFLRTVIFLPDTRFEFFIETEVM